MATQADQLRKSLNNVPNGYSAEGCNGFKFFIDALQDILAPSQDEYWKAKSGTGKLPPGLITLRQRVNNLAGIHNPESALDQIALIVANLNRDSQNNCLLTLNQLIIQAQKNKVKIKDEKEIAKFKREIDFFVEFKLKNETLAVAIKLNDTGAEAKAHYELGVLCIKKDPISNYDIAIEHFTKAIQGSCLEFKAYALRERANLYGIQEKTEEERKINLEQKIKELQESCRILEQLKEFREEQHIKERAKTFLSYGEELMVLEKYEDAIQALTKARRLRPDNERTISLLLRAHNSKAPCKNVFEYIKYVEFDSASLNGIDLYLSRYHFLPLWLEAARYGSISLARDLAPHVDKSVKDKEDNNALHYAAQAGHIELVNLLGNWLNYENQNKQGFTPVMVAAKEGRVDLVLNLLFKHGVKPVANVTDILSVIVANQQSLVFEALAAEDTKYHELLIAIGLFLQKSTPASMDSKTAELCKKIAIGHCYQVAINAKSLIMLKKLIEYHPEGLSFLYKGDSPLHYCLKSRYKEGVYLLVENGSSLVLANSQKQKPIDVAKENDSDLEAYIHNAINRIQQKEKLIAENYQKFIETCIAKFQEELKEKSDLRNTKNIERLRRCLKEVFGKPVNQGLFDDNTFKTSKTLILLIIKTILEKVQKGNEITKRANILGGVKFDREKLKKLLQDVINSPWQLKKVLEPDLSFDKVESKTSKEYRMLSPIAVVFCERFEKQFDEAYGYFRAVATGELVPVQDAEEQRKIDLAKQLANHLPSVSVPIANISLPVGTIVAGAMDLMLYFRQRCRKKQAERMVLLFKAVTPSERTHFVRYTAEQLVDKYHHQIHHLSPGSEGVEVFADCAVARVVQYITSDDQNQVAYEPSKFSDAIRVIQSWLFKKEIPPEQRVQKTLYDIFLDGIVRVLSDFPKDKERLHTINQLTMDDNWNSKGIFENTGVELVTGEKYAHPNINVNLYGYCKGTKEEAEKRCLTLGPDPKNGAYWGPGRQWDKPQDAQALTPYPHANGKPVLTAFEVQKQSLVKEKSHVTQVKENVVKQRSA